MSGAVLGLLLAAAPAAASPPKPELVLQTGHVLPVEAVALSRDGSLLATGSRDGKAMLWEARTGRKLREFAADPLGVAAVALSPDGARLLTGGAGTASLWDAATGRRLKRFGLPGEFLKTVAFTPDGKRVLTAGEDSAVKLWDAATGQKLRAFDTMGPRAAAAALSPDGKLLAVVAGTDAVWVFGVETGELKRSLSGGGPWTAAAFGPDAKLLVTGGAEEARVWELGSGKARASFKSSASLGVAMTPDARRIATCGGANTARLWDAKSGEAESSFIGHTDAVRALALSPDGRRLATASDDHSARLWGVASAKTLQVFDGTPRRTLFAAFSDDGRRLVTVSPEEARLWDLRQGRPVAVSTGDWEGASGWSLSGDGRLLACLRGRDNASLRNLETGAEDAQAPWAAGKSQAVALDAGGRSIASAVPERVRLWDVPSGKELGPVANPGPAVMALWAGLNAARLLGENAQGKLALWELPGGRLLAAFGLEGSMMPHVVLSRGGRILAAGAVASGGRMSQFRYVISVRDMSDGRELRTWETKQEVRPFAFGPEDGSLLTQGEGAVWSWDVLTGRKVGSFQLPESASLPWPQAVHPRGRRVLAEEGGRLLILSLPAGKRLGRISVTDRGWLVEAQDGRWDGSGDVLRWTTGLKSFPYAKFAGAARSPGLLSQLLGR